MLALYGRDGKRRDQPIDEAAALPPSDVVWFDLLQPAPGEVRLVERATGLALPSFEALSEIESSSRIRVLNQALYLSVPLVHTADTDEPHATPVGFVLTPDRLITVRFEALAAFTTFSQGFASWNAASASSASIFAGLMETIIDHGADALERIAAELDGLSHRLFRVDGRYKHQRRRPVREEADLRNSLRRVGHSGDLASKIRDSLLGIARVVPFVANHGADWLPADVKPRFDILRQDVASLSDYDSHLVNKVQLLLDATLGLINIEQNNIIKVLTVVSVVGVPPTLVASMYGMNFRHMPELDWAWGYPYGLALIVLSAILPLAWFKWRRWL
jgi:magnesium transporter